MPENNTIHECYDDGHFSLPWVDLRDDPISMFSEESYLDGDLRRIKIAFLNGQITLECEVKILSRVESYEPALIVLQRKTGYVYLAVAGNKPYAVKLTDDSEAALIEEGEVIIEDINWLPHMKIVSFFKHYLLSETFQKVIAGFESDKKWWIKKEPVITEENMYENHYKFRKETSGLTCLPEDAWTIPKDW